MGIDHVLKGECWAFDAVNNTRMTTCIISIPANVLSNLVHSNTIIHKGFQAYREKMKVIGSCQVDYIIDGVKLEMLNFNSYKNSF